MDRPLEHLSDAELEAFVRRASAPSTLIETDAHLSVCADCRQRLAGIARAGSLYAGARKAVLQDDGMPHLSYVEVRAAAEGRPSKMAVRHLESCAECRDEVADLARFTVTLGRPLPVGRRAPVVMLRRWAIAATLLIAVPLAWWAWRSNMAPRYTVSIHDGGGLVALDTADGLHTPAPVPPDAAAALKTVLQSRRLTIPQGNRSSQPEVLLGPPARTSGPAVIIRYPVNETVLTPKPRFEWEASGAADGYRVSVYDRGFRLVTESPVLAGGPWSPSVDLVPGQSYTWVVGARMGGREIHAPAPPAPEARFTVLSSAESARLQEMRRKYPAEHLMLAALLAQAGALTPAWEELEALERANPGSEVVQQIAESLPGGAHQAPSSSKPAQ